MYGTPTDAIKYVHSHIYALHSSLRFRLGKMFLSFHSTARTMLSAWAAFVSLALLPAALGTRPVLPVPDLIQIRVRAYMLHMSYEHK